MRYLGWVLILLLILVGLNLVWLGTSTVRIKNASQLSIDSIAYRACETTHHVGTLQSNQSVFRFLEACGDDTLEILVGNSSFCQTYVEGELYHVDAIIQSPKAVNCTYDDLFSSLFIAKVFW